MMTAREYARTCWRSEGWGEPSGPYQERQWTLFFTGQEPDETYRPRSWTRPEAWVEIYVGGKRARRARRATVLSV